MGENVSQNSVPSPWCCPRIRLILFFFTNAVRTGISALPTRPLGVPKRGWGISGGLETWRTSRDGLSEALRLDGKGEAMRRLDCHTSPGAFSLSLLQTCVLRGAHRSFTRSVGPALLGCLLVVTHWGQGHESRVGTQEDLGNPASP